MVVGKTYFPFFSHYLYINQTQQRYTDPPVFTGTHSYIPTTASGRARAGRVRSLLLQLAEWRALRQTISVWH